MEEPHIRAEGTSEIISGLLPATAYLLTVTAKKNPNEESFESSSITVHTGKFFFFLLNQKLNSPFPVFLKRNVPYIELFKDGKYGAAAVY